MNTLIDERHTQCDDNQSSQENYASPVSSDLVGKSSLITSLLKFSPGALSQVQGNATFTAWGVSRRNQFKVGALHAANFAGMEFATVPSIRSGSRPDLDTSIASANIHIPLGVKVDDIHPSNLRHQNGVGDDYSFIANLNFWLYKDQIQEGQSCSNQEDGCDEVFYTAKAEAGPQGEKREQRANSSEDVTASGSKSLGVIHGAIFSQRTIPVDRKAL